MPLDPSPAAPEDTTPWPEVEAPPDDRFGEIARQAVEVMEAWQRADELAWLLRRVEGARRVLEVGRARGGTLWALCQVADAEASIVSIDSWGFTKEELARFEGLPRVGQRLQLVHEDSVAAMDMLRHRPQRYDLIVIDADHERVHDDWNAALHLVEPDGLIALHDIFGAREHTGRVPELWETISRRDSRGRVASYVTGRDATWGGWGLVRQ